MRGIAVFALVVLVGSLAAYAAPPLHGNQAESEKSPAAANQQATDQQSETFLGIAVEEVPRSLASHLHGMLAKGQGLVVEQVAEHSPAANAGLKQDDILAAFGDQKLFSSEQLVKLVRAEKPGSNVTFGFVRDGKKENVEVTLGDERDHLREVGSGEGANALHRGRVHTHPMIRAPHGFVGSHHGSKPAEWEQFDSMSLQKTGKDQFKVAISYLDDKGKTERHEFQGTRDEIHKAIHSEKDLPASERAHLLRALDMPEHSNFMPGVRFVPGEGLIIDLGGFAPTGSEQPGSDANF